MFPHGSDYIFILISKASPISDRLAVLPEGIVVEPSGFPAWLLIVFVFKRSEFPAVKEIFVSTLLYRPAVVYFTGWPPTQIVAGHLYYYIGSKMVCIADYG